ncbi:MAG: malonyl-[acyl-carrier protein] O-methyltransferase BioC [Gammaproteobacteria bacterium]|nr:MAG: malonyl-[acyl-carrier protein] O-methyltransferase BioC [Gammaproteobacteria bacterium]
MDSQSGFLLERSLVKRSFNQAAETYDEVAVLQREVGQRLIERLDYIRMKPQILVDLGCGTGEGIKLLKQRYSGAEVLGIDMAHAMLKVSKKKWPRWSLASKPKLVCADVEQLPLAEQSVDMIVSNLTFQWLNGIDMVLQECRRILRPGGLLMFTTFGPDTLKEMRECWHQLDPDGVHVNRFLDLHDIGDALLANRFMDPVMDMEMFTLTYSDVRKMMQELKALGAHNVNRGRSAGLTGKNRLQSLVSAYEKFRNAGRLPATYEVIYGHAWIPEQASVLTNEGMRETRVPLTAIQKTS